LHCMSFFGLRLLRITPKSYQRVIRNSRKAKNDRQCNVQKIPKGNQK
jgi:hypothetical protein